MLIHSVILLCIPALIAASCKDQLENCKDHYVFVMNQGDTLKMACCAVTGVMTCLEHRASGYCQSSPDRNLYNELRGNAERIQVTCNMKLSPDGDMPPECNNIVVVGRAWWKAKLMIIIGCVVAALVVVTLIVVGIWCAIKKKKGGN